MRESTSRTYSARWIFPINAPPLQQGTITIAGDKIGAVDAHGRRRADVDLGNVAILPGFVNAHTHLDLTGARGLFLPTPLREGGGDFTTWLRRVIAFRRAHTPQEVQADIEAGLADCLRFGTTLIGDISAGGASWKALASASCRAIVFHELLGLTTEGMRRAWDAATAWLQMEDTPECRRGLSPHAPYSVHRELFERSDATGKPLAVHLAETEEEMQLLRHHAGPFVEFLKELNVWYPPGLIPPEPYLCRFLSSLFIHGNYLDALTPFTPQQSLVVCPRTHAAFGHPHHPFPYMLKRGVCVALGTDSLASNPDLDILAEARFLRRHYPEVEPAAILRMLTLSGAEVLRMDAITGSLRVGKSADLVVLPLPDAQPVDPHDLVLESALPVMSMMFRGNELMQN